MKTDPKKKQTSSGKTPAEKRTTAFLFSCIGGILYVIPCISAIFLGIVTDGMSPAFILGIVAVVLGIPNSLFAMHAFSERKYRGIVIACDAVLIVLHLIVLPFLGTWYIILSPAFLLLVLNIAFSDTIVNH